MIIEKNIMITTVKLRHNYHFFKSLLPILHSIPEHGQFLNLLQMLQEPNICRMSQLTPLYSSCHTAHYNVKPEYTKKNMPQC